MQPAISDCRKKNCWNGFFNVVVCCEAQTADDQMQSKDAYEERKKERKGWEFCVGHLIPGVLIILI
jgi:hypothetical protein